MNDTLQEPKVITTEDFLKGERQLNLDGLQIEKSISKNQFVENYVSKGFEVYTKPNLQKFVSDVDAKMDALEKGGDDFNKDEIVKAGKDFLGSLNRVVVKDGDKLSELFVRKAEEGAGEEGSEGGDTFVKADEGTDEDEDETEPKEVAKAEDASLNKGGEVKVLRYKPSEGSRGGNVIGHTKSGNPIYGAPAEKKVPKKEVKKEEPKKETNAAKEERILDSIGDSIAKERTRLDGGDKEKLKELAIMYKKQYAKWGKVKGKEEPKKDIKKALNILGLDTIEPKEVLEVIEKGYGISDALGERGDKQFKKTGKEVKEKLTELIQKITTKADGYKTQMEVYHTKLGIAPTRDLDEWETRTLDENQISGLRHYDWDMTYFNTTHDSGMGHAYLPGKTGEVGGETRTYAKSKEEADLASHYNTALRKYLGCLRDQKQVSVFERNLEEKKTYELSLNQIAALGF